MPRTEPIRATFSRDEIEKRINKSLEENDGEIQRPTINNARMTVEDCIYDELRNIHGTVAGNQVALESIDERLCETNDLLWRIVNKDTHKGKELTQEDIDNYINSVKDYYVDSEQGEDEMKKVKFSKSERHTIYQALGSRISTLRNQIGYTRVNEDGTLRDQIIKNEKLIAKLKNS